MPLRCMALAAAWEALPPLAARCAAADGSSTFSVCARRAAFAPAPSAFRLFRRSPHPRGGADNSRRGGKACAPVASAALRPPREASLAVLVQQRRRAATSRSSRHWNF